MSGDGITRREVLNQAGVFSSCSSLLFRSPSSCNAQVNLTQKLNRRSSAKSLLEILCPEMLQAVTKTKDFAYRGEHISPDQMFSVLNPEYDLFVAYGEKGRIFFEALEKYLLEKCDGLTLHDPALPSRSHVFVGSRDEAARWGSPCSIWPVGKLNYLWFRNQRLVYPEKNEDWQKNPQYFDGLDIRQSELSEALSLGHEVMFTSKTFLASPHEFQEQLRFQLGLDG